GRTEVRIDDLQRVVARITEQDARAERGGRYVENLPRSRQRAEPSARQAYPHLQVELKLRAVDPDLLIRCRRLEGLRSHVGDVRGTACEKAKRRRRRAGGIVDSQRVRTIVGEGDVQGEGRCRDVPHLQRLEHGHMPATWKADEDSQSRLKAAAV